MKAVFTCDEVFDILTREPFPSGGAEDDFVESHLAVCYECRQLAEAFRPAVGLFHESMSTGSDDELPMYCGRLLPIVDALSHPQRAAVSPARKAFIMTVLVIAASVVLVGSAVFATLAVNQRADDPGAVALSKQHHQNRDFTLLAALEIPKECRSTTTAMSLVSAADLACCTKCHKAGSRVTSTEKAIVKSSAACVACHDGMLNATFSAAERWRIPVIEYDSRSRNEYCSRPSAIPLESDGFLWRGERAGNGKREVATRGILREVAREGAGDRWVGTDLPRRPPMRTSTSLAD